MAVLKPNLSWTTLQEKQLVALESINTNILKNVNNNKKYSEGFSDIVDSNLQAANIIVHGIDAIWNSKSLENILRDIPSSNKQVVSAIKDTKDNDEEDRDLEEKYLDEAQIMLDDFVSSLEDTVKDFLKNQYKLAYQSADQYSSLYNDIIRYTGSDENEAQQFRRDIINQVSSINKDLGGIGGKLDPKESLRTMLAVSQSTNISNLDTLKELTAPVLLAQETTNLSLGELSKLGGRMYTRYRMESGSIENLVDHIRNVTEGQDVSEDKILTAISNVETRLGLHYGGNSDMLEKASESLASGISFLESNYINAGAYIEDIYKLFSTDERDKTELKAKYYSDYDEILALATSGSVDRAMELMLEHTSELNTITAKELGHDSATSEEAQLWAMTGKTLDEFYESVEKDATARERTADKYVSIEQQVYNKLSEATSYLATMQENIGIGFSDVAIGVSMIGTVASHIKTLNTISRLLGGSGASVPAGGSSIIGVLSKFGPALGVAGATVGLALYAKDIYDTVKKDEEDELDKYEEALSNTTEFGYGRVARYNSDTGETEWSYEAFQSQEEADAYQTSKKSMDNLYTNEQWDSLGFWDKIKYNVLAAAQNYGMSQSGYAGLDYDYVKGSDIYSDTLLSVQQAVEDLLNKPEYEDMRMFYAGKGLISTNDQLEKIGENLKEYKQAYDEGMYLADGKWFYIGDDTLVPKSEAPAAFAEGTNYIGRDQLAYLHKGEAVTPAKYNPANNMNELERLRAQEGQDNTSGLEEVIELLSGIHSYLQYWKADSDKKEAIASTRGMIPQRANMLNYFTGGR